MALSGHRHGQWRHVLAGAIAIGALAWTPVRARAQAAASEYQLKAVFLFHFAQFVEWPDGKAPAAKAPLTICILGDDPFGAHLDETVRGETVNEHPLVIQRHRRIEDLAACHVLFISQSGRRGIEEVLDSAQGRSILTVADVERFAERGGMIQFVTEQQKIRLRVNLAVAEAAKLKLSSKLLRSAEIVATRKD